MTFLLLLLAGIWGGYAVFGRRWRIEPRLDFAASSDESARVVAIVPARNEAAELPHTLTSLLSQSHANLKVVLVDDHSDDGTAEVARSVAAGAGAADRLIVLSSAPLEPGWTGKVWAQHQGVEHATDLGAEWLWLTDADIHHDKDVLTRLLATAGGRRRDFVSVMARLRCDTVFEKLLIPAFTYFFAGLYSFHRIGDDGLPTAGAAGGCMLVRRQALERAGGLAAIRDAVIDDVALGTVCKNHGARLWLGYDPGVVSTRGYETLAAIWRMVARSAYNQLGYNPFALIGSVLGLGFVFLLPVAGLVGGGGGDRLLALIALAGMARTYRPMVHYLGCAPGWALALPLSAALYCGMTVTSAWRYYAGTGNPWKGRAYDA